MDNQKISKEITAVDEDFECSECGKKVKGSDKICPHCKASLEETIQISNISDKISGRYLDAFSLAKIIVSYGNSVKFLGLFIAGVFLLISFGSSSSSFSDFRFYIFCFFAMLILCIFYIIGVFICAGGQLIQANLDCAVNSSPILTRFQKETLYRKILV